MDRMAEEVCDAVDAMVFTGDALLNRENLKEFREYLARWTRGANEHEETIKVMEEEARNGNAEG